MIAVVKSGGYIQYLWNDDQKDLAIRWAQVQLRVFRGSPLAVVDAATLDAEAVEEAFRKQALLETRLKERG